MTLLAPKMDRYLYVQSDESNAYFVDNSTTRFRVQLKFPLYLPGVWKVALVEFHATDRSKATTKRMIVFIFTRTFAKKALCMVKKDPYSGAWKGTLMENGTTFSTLLFMYQ